MDKNLNLQSEFTQKDPVTSVGSRIHLLIALRRTIQEDNSPLRAKDFQDVMKLNRAIRLVYQFYSFLRPGWISSLALAAFGLKSFLALIIKEQKKGQILFTYTFSNERSVGDYINKCTEAEKVCTAQQSTKLVFRLENLKLLISSLGSFKKCCQYLRIIRKLNQDYDFMPACRAASTICYYLRFKKELQKNHFSAVLVAKNYSPDCLALVWAAKSLQIPSIYCSHSFAPPVKIDKPPLSFSLLLLQGEAMHQIFAERARIEGEVAYKGIAGSSIPLRLEKLKPIGMNIGIFLSGATNVAGVERQIENIIKNFSPQQILIRLHPVSLVNADISHLTKKYKFIKLTFGTKLQEDLAQVDFVMVGNSGVLLEVLKAGYPCVYVGNLEYIEFDYNGFVANRIVPYWPEDQNLSISEIINFYQADWQKAFRRYDPYYLIDSNPEEIVRNKIINLLQRKT